MSYYRNDPILSNRHEESKANLFKNFDTTYSSSVVPSSSLDGHHSACHHRQKSFTVHYQIISWRAFTVLRASWVNGINVQKFIPVNSCIRSTPPVRAHHSYASKFSRRRWVDIFRELEDHVTSSSSIFVVCLCLWKSVYLLAIHWIDSGLYIWFCNKCHNARALRRINTTAIPPVHRQASLIDFFSLSQCAPPPPGYYQYGRHGTCLHSTVSTSAILHPSPAGCSRRCKKYAPAEGDLLRTYCSRAYKHIW